MERIITFCGHSSVSFDVVEMENKIMSILEEELKGAPVQFYLGGYGQFDGFALRCCKKYKALHPEAKLIFITPYLDDDYLRNRDIFLKEYDEVIFPEIENVPKKYAISKRNQWMVQKADLLIAYIDHSWGGAVKTLEYAIRSKKRFVNLGKWER